MCATSPAPASASRHERACIKPYWDCCTTGTWRKPKRKTRDADSRITTEGTEARRERDPKSSVFSVHLWFIVSIRVNTVARLCSRQISVARLRLPAAQTACKKYQSPAATLHTE